MLTDLAHAGVDGVLGGMDEFGEVGDEVAALTTELLDGEIDEVAMLGK